MTKKWTQRESTAGLTVSPELVNTELRAQQSAITSLDRTQLPANSVDDTRLKDYALHRVYAEKLYPSGGSSPGEQDAARDADVGTIGWISETLQVQTGGWRNVSTPFEIDFAGGQLFVEWSCNVYAHNIFALGLNDGLPGTPNTVRLRILVNGVNIAERRGGYGHQTSRLMASQLFPQGTLEIALQFKSTPASQDCADTDSGDNTPYCHVWNNRYLIVGRHR